MKTLSTELNDRILRFDGVSIIHTDQVEKFLLKGLKPSQIRVTELTPEIVHFNENVTAAERLSDKLEEPISFSFTWKIPPEYLSLDVEQHVLAVFGERLPGLAYSDSQTEVAIARVAQELEEYNKRGLTNLLRVIIYVLDTFKKTEQVFGVGRGSSCASFILFLLGLHAVDPIKYEVPLEEFMHD